MKNKLHRLKKEKFANTIVRDVHFTCLHSIATNQFDIGWCEGDSTQRDNLEVLD